MKNILDPCFWSFRCIFKNASWINQNTRLGVISLEKKSEFLLPKIVFPNPNLHACGAKYSDTYSQHCLHCILSELSLPFRPFPEVACSSPPVQWQSSNTPRKVHSARASPPATDTPKLLCINVYLSQML